MATVCDRTPLLRPTPAAQHRHAPPIPSARVFYWGAVFALVFIAYVSSSNWERAVESLSSSASTADGHVTTTVDEMGSSSSSSSSSSSTNGTTDAVIFSVIGDWGRLGLYYQRETGQAMANVLPSNTQSIISAGDNFYDYGVTSVNDELFQKSFEDVYTDPVLKRLPWYVVLGNHDYRGSVHAQIEYTSVSRRWNMPSRYFSLRLASDLIGIFIDTTPLSSSHEGETARKNPEVNTERQLMWLKNTLRSAPPRCRFFVVGHHNMYSSSLADHKGDIGVRDAFEPVLAPFASRIIAYVAGHEHALMHMQPYAGMVSSSESYDHFVSGAGSRLRPIVAPNATRSEHWRTCCNVLAPSDNASMPRTVWSSSVNGFFIYKIQGDRFSSTAYDKDGRIIHEHERVLAAV